MRRRCSKRASSRASSAQGADSVAADSVAAEILWRGWPATLLNPSGPLARMLRIFLSSALVLSLISSVRSGARGQQPLGVESVRGLEAMALGLRARETGL